MPKFADKSQCTGCTACVSICPRNCIQMKKDNAGFEFPVIMERSACIACGACERVCPVLMKKKDDENLSTSAYAAFSNNNALRLESSSGGIFSELAATILQRGGVIYGASYDDEGVVRHIEIKEQTELGKLQGAKYSQSILGDCFLSIKKQLDSGRIVLFSGTPCQVAGLKAFLKRDYENLVCIDFVCHGVPSPMVWEKYVKYRSLTDNSDSFPQHINLRNKESGWSHYAYSVEFAYADKKRYLCKNGDDPFMQLFVKDYISNYYKIFIPICLVILGVSFFFAKEILTLFFSSQYAHETQVFLILVITFLMNMLFRNLFGNLLSAVGEMKKNTIISIFSLIVLGVSAFILVPEFQILGMGISVFLAMSFSGFLGMFFFWKYFKKLG